MSSTVRQVRPRRPSVWRKAFLDLRPGASPYPGLTGEKWREVHEKMTDFLDRFADEATTLGWTTLDLFGVHPQVGIIRPDFCGALVMSEAKVTSLTATRMAFTNTAFYRDTPGRHDRSRANLGVREAITARVMLPGRHDLEPTP